MYLLDTNHCSQLLEKYPTVTRKLSDLGDVIVGTCVIVQGELVFGASISEQWKNKPSTDQGVFERHRRIRDRSGDSRHLWEY